MDPAGHTLDLSGHPSRVDIAVDGTTLASSERVVVLQETGLPPRYYFPRDDVRLDLSDASTTATACPFKGQASYFTFVVDGTEHRDLAWSYERPINGVERITDLVCFFDERVDVTIASELQERPITAWSPAT